MSFIQKSEEILLRLRHDGWADRWYEGYGIEPIRRFRRELPSDPEIERILEKWLENMKYEEEKINKVHNKEFWLVQAAALRALREETERICQIDDLKKKGAGL